MNQKQINIVKLQNYNDDFFHAPPKLYILNEIGNIPLHHHGTNLFSGLKSGSRKSLSRSRSIGTYS